jgi:protein TonB
MAKDINITSTVWRELVFDGKNKDYGAYTIRKNSSKRHIIAYITVIIFIILVMVLPSLVEFLTPVRDDQGVTETTKISNIEIALPDENKVEQINVPPPPALKSTIKFAVTTIKKDEEVPDEEIKTQEELFEAKAAISIADVQGNDESGKDIADLEDHRLITEEKDEVFLVGAVEQNPEFPGGNLSAWLSSNLKYPAIATEMGIEGRVIVQFTVGKDGAIRDVIILRGVDSALDKEAVRVVNKMPKWIPGRQGGTPVSVRYTLPVVFKLNQQR